jgi:hypothetical protein
MSNDIDVMENIARYIQMSPAETQHHQAALKALFPSATHEAHAEVWLRIQRNAPGHDGEKGRAAPGLGSPVWVFVAEKDTPDKPDSVCRPDNDGYVVMGGGAPQEDYSTCAWPVCVKIKPGTYAPDAAAGLRRIADWIDTSGANDAFDRHMFPRRHTEDAPY